MIHYRARMWLAALAAIAALWAGVGSATSQPLGETGLAGAESVRMSAIQARLGTEQIALQTEQDELQRQMNGGLLPQGILASRSAVLRDKSNRLRANIQVANADIAMTRAALAKAPSASPGPEATGYTLTWVLTAKGAYFATPGRDWIYYDKERPLRQTTLREIGSAAAAYVVLLDPETNLRQAIRLDEKTIDIQQPPSGMSVRKEPILGAGADVHGQNVMQVAYPGGSFEQRSPGVWIERQRGQTFATFSELKRTRDMVQLLDGKRDLQLFFSIPSAQILFSTSGRPSPKTLYPIKSMAARYVRPGPSILRDE
jgi:hypothetical protein